MYVVVALLFFVPGLLVCAPLGVRGWRLAAAAPAVTFGLAATGGPVLSKLHVRWSLLSFGLYTLVVAVIAFGAAWLWSRLRTERRAGAEAGATAVEPGSGPRARWEHLVVGGGVLLGMAMGAVVFLRGSRGLSAVAQDWDAPFHANAVRWIADHGQALPAAVAPIANFEPGHPYFYPITYHSVLALVVQQFGVSPSWALNAGALTVILLWPLGIAALGLAWRLPAPVVAVAAAVSTWFTAFPYDSLWRGPLWPFVAGLALLPGVLAAAKLLIDRSPIVGAAVTVAFGITGVVSMHTSIAFIVLVYALTLLVAFLLRLEPIRWRSAGWPMVLGGVLTVVLLLPVVLPATVDSSGVQAARWPEFASSTEAFGQVLLFSPVSTSPQWFLGLTALVGLVVMVLRRRLLWLVGAYVIFGAAYAATASIDSDFVNTISGPFYNDAWRLAALLPLAGAFAVGEALVAVGEWLAPRLRFGASWMRVVGVAAAGLVVLGLLGNMGYAHRNAQHLEWNYGDGPTVSTGEIAAYKWLGNHVKGGERVMNDRLDGSVWMYALADVQPMEWTFYGAADDSTTGKLRDHLNTMDTDASVRRLMAKADVRYVIVGNGFVRADDTRAPGLQHLDQVHSLEQVFRNDGAVIYEVKTGALS